MEKIKFLQMSFRFGRNVNLSVSHIFFVSVDVSKAYDVEYVQYKCIKFWSIILLLQITDTAFSNTYVFDRHR